jgi:uncharacterized protein (DUF2336 family)
MPDKEVNALLGGKDEEERSQIAQRVGDRLSTGELSQTDRRAAEMLARELVLDAIVRVRRALSQALRHAKILPRDIALTIAHDVDSVSCPFLAVTDVFSDEDWRQLLLTISRGARATVAGRSPMKEAIAEGLAGIGDAFVAETLIQNVSAPMTLTVCESLMDRFETEVGVLDKLALRDDLIADIVVRLTGRVSQVAREKLREKYNIPDSLDPVAEEASVGAVIELLKETHESDLMIVVQTLRADNKLTPIVLLKALAAGHAAFLEVGLEVLSGRTAAHVRSVVRRADENAVEQLLGRANIPTAMFPEFWANICNARLAA